MKRPGRSVPGRGIFKHRNFEVGTPWPAGAADRRPLNGWAACLSGAVAVGGVQAGERSYKIVQGVFKPGEKSILFCVRSGSHWRGEAIGEGGKSALS